ncbi:WXG100 family type VII secretion target [Mycobacteroides abscessus]|uniref:WXG100 family type VII secretion target n=5 Tax=Mycobacteroides abscessus TaxID=36809 RepID=UPI000925D2C4|nr:WXG100 family type VII secretion target [Mycobacteroides abscessus]SIM86995.1 ESAT-6-like protein [Mycobacteroides abscessus subsp. abscessus]
MSQITFNYPAMLAHAGEMNTYSGVLTALGADLAAQQASLQAAWHGDTSMSQAAWQAQWNTALLRQRRASSTSRSCGYPECSVRPANWVAAPTSWCRLLMHVWRCTPSLPSG